MNRAVDFEETKNMVNEKFGEEVCDMLFTEN